MFCEIQGGGWTVTLQGSEIGDTTWGGEKEEI